MRMGVAGPDVNCPHGVHVNMGCPDCARVERRRMAIPTVAMMAAVFANRVPAHVAVSDRANVIAAEAWELYEAVVRKV